MATQLVLGNYLTLMWSVPPSMRAFASLALMLRAWTTIQFLVLFVAWQYNPFWMMVAGVGLTLLDAALYFPFLRDVEQCIYRIAQEAMTNVARHSDAKSLRVALRHLLGALTLTIADDGHGFDPTQVNDTRYGLKGLRERAEMIGASLHVDSQLKTGTTIKLVVPLVE